MSNSTIMIPLCGESKDKDCEWNGGDGRQAALDAMEFGARVATAVAGQRVDLVDTVRDMVDRGVIDEESAPDDFFALVVALTQAETRRPATEAGSPCDERHVKLYLPVELESARRELVRFFEGIIYKLRRNTHKGKWENVSVTKAFELLREEVDELEKAMDEGNSIECHLEGCDVAAYALILSSIAMEKGIK